MRFQILLFFILIGAIPALASLQEHSERYGFIDTTGQFAIKPKFLYAQNFSEGIAWVLSEEGSKLDPQRFDAIDSHGLILFKINGIAVEPYKNGYSKVIQKEKDIFIDKTGKTVQSHDAKNSTKTDAIEPFGHAVTDGKSLVFYPSDSRLDHQRNGLFCEELCHVTYHIPGEDEHYQGYIDRANHVVLQLPQHVKECGDFHDGLAPVAIELTAVDKSNPSKLVKMGFINHQGDSVIPPIYDLPVNSLANPLEAVQFHDHVALVKLHGVDCYIDDTGKTIAQFKQGTCSNFSEGLAAVSQVLDTER